MGLYQLNLNEANVRKITQSGFARLKKKILENVYEPLKVWKKGNIVLSGNQRLSVMRHLVENDGYTIDDVNVAVYDVDEKTAKFIELSDNEHEGKYDLDKLVEEMGNIEELDLTDVLDPKLMAKVELKSKESETVDVSELDEGEVDPEIFENNTTDIIITNVPKVDSFLFYDTIARVAKVMGTKSDWVPLKTILELVQGTDDDELREMCVTNKDMKEYL